MPHFFRHLLLLATLTLVGLSSAQVIDFETIPGGSPVDNAIITDQFRVSHGVRFRLDTTGNGLPDSKFPRIEATGQDGTDAFVGIGGNDKVGLTLTGRLGDFFLRSHLSRDAGATAPLSLIILYDAPVSAASAEIWDIDGFASTEQWQIDAMGADYVNANDVTDVVDSLLSPIGNTTLLHAKPWTFSFDHHGTSDIHALRIQFVGSKTDSIGFAFDNFSPSSPAAGLDDCGSGLPPLRSSMYGGSSANTVQFAHQSQFNTSIATTVEAWVYREDIRRFETIAGQTINGGLWFGFFPQLRFYRSGSQFASATRNVEEERWTHVAVSYDGTTARFYIDGEPAGEQALTNAGTGGSLPLMLGGEPLGFELWGNLDEVRIWSVARTEAQIRNGMLREIRSAPGLQAVFPEGGMNEAVFGLTGTAPAPPDSKVWGMLPNYLVVPRVNSVTFDGEPIAATEYAGAEEIPIRYDSGPDGHAYLVYTDNAGDADDKLYVGVTGLREPAGGSNRDISQIGVFLDADRSRSAFPQSRDFYLRTTLNGQKSSDIFGNGSGGWRGVAAGNFDEVFLATNNQIKSVIPSIGEFYPPVFEFQIGKSLVGNFTSPVGFALAHFNAEGLFDSDIVPPYAVSNKPSTWTCLTFGDAVDRPTTRPLIRVRVQDADTRELLPGYQVWIRDAGTGEILAEVQTSPSGEYSGNLTLPADRPFQVQIPNCSDCTHLAPLISAGGVQPSSTSPLLVDFVGVEEGFGTFLARVSFQIRRPLPPIVFSAIEQSFAAAPTLMRTTPDFKVVPEVSTITLHGEHFHDNLEVYLYNCLNMPPVESSICREGIDYIRCEVDLDSISADRTSMVVRLPVAQTGPWDIAIKDNWLRPGVLTPLNQWTRRGSLYLTLPDYPQLYGFEFINEADNREFDGTRWPLFTSVFQENMYRPAAFCAPDPMYVLFSAVFGAVDRNIKGTCVGMASTSKLFALGNLDVSDFGANYPFGLPGLPHPTESGYFVPPQPDRYTFDGVCKGHRPINLWGNIRRNHMAQLSHEVIDALFDQVDGSVSSGGSPRLVYQRLEASTAYVLSIKRSGSAHAITPIRVHEGFKVSTNSYSMTTDPTSVSWDAGIPRYRTIEIYDNNYPGVSRFIGIDWETNRFFYDRGEDKDGNVLADYEGKAIFTLPISIWQNGRTRPRIIRDGLEILYEVVMGDANVEHEDASGNRWGWDAAGTFREDYPGAKTMLLMDGLEDDIRNGLFFPPPGEVPSKTIIHGNGGDYLFHADQGDVMVQLHASGTLGNADTVELQTDGTDRLRGFRFLPQISRSGVRASVGAEFNATETATFDLSGMDLEAGKGLMVELIESGIGVSVKNEGTQPLSYRLKINAADYAAGSANNQSFGEITVPPGAAQIIALTQWPQNNSVRATTDLDDDGFPDSIVFVDALPPPHLDLQRTGDEIEITWQVISGAVLMSSPDLFNWSPVSGVVIDGNSANYRAPIDEAGDGMFFQLRD